MPHGLYYLPAVADLMTPPLLSVHAFLLPTDCNFPTIDTDDCQQIVVNRVLPATGTDVLWTIGGACPLPSTVPSVGSEWQSTLLCLAPGRYQFAAQANSTQFNSTHLERFTVAVLDGSEAAVIPWTGLKQDRFNQYFDVPEGV